MNKKITIITLLLFCSLQLSSQTMHEFSLNVGADISSFLYRQTENEKINEFGVSFGFDYNYYFNNSFGIGTGLYGNRFDSKCQLTSLSESYLANDGMRDFEYRYSLNDYLENQTIFMLQIPLMARFRTNFFYTALGVKVGIPVSSKYSNKLYRLDASGYYPEYDLTLHDPAFMGFGSFYNLDNKGKLDVKPVIFLSTEVGLRTYLKHNILIYTGLFVDYGISKFIKVGDSKLIEYHGNDNYKPNSALSSVSNGKALTNTPKLFTVGVKLGFSMTHIVAKQK